MLKKKKNILVAALACSGLWTAPGFAQSAQTARSCDRACLTAVLDGYLQALREHDAAKLPLTADARYTENGQVLGLRDGMWGTVSGPPPYRFDIVDPEQGTIVMIGLIPENGNFNYLAVRLKVEDGARISEMENVVGRNGTTGNTRIPDTLKAPHPLFLERVPAAERLSREQLVRIADSYFTGLDNEESGRNVPFDAQCQRKENGTIMTGLTAPDAREMMKLGCKAQFDTGFSVVVTDVRARRFVAVDPEFGNVFAFAFFDHAGTVAGYKDPAGVEHGFAASLRQPSTLMIGEVFKVKEGRIRQIEAVLASVPYKMTAGW
ncbi:MAG: hypothetical protein ABW278_16105 [Steroidobacteraceae bacterium]